MESIHTILQVATLGAGMAPYFSGLLLDSLQMAVYLTGEKIGKIKAHNTFFQ